MSTTAARSRLARSALTAALSAAAALAMSACAGQDVAASTKPPGTRPVQVGAVTWYLPTTVQLAPPPSSSSSPARANDPYTWTVQGSGTWDGRSVKVFGRAANGVRDAALLSGQLLGIAQVGGIPSFHSLGSHATSVLGADKSESLLFSYNGSDGKGQGMWVTAVQTKSTHGVVVQVATPERTVDPAFAQKVVDSLHFGR